MKRPWVIPIISMLLTVGIGATVKQMSHLNSFNAGEMSPLMNSRADFVSYDKGARTLQNMLVRAQGPVQRRPGTKYIAEVKESADEVRLIPFEYSTEDTYIIELGDLYARFYRNGAQILADDVNVYEIVTPWDCNDLFELHFDQDAQYMRVVHPDYQPYKITRTGHAVWTCTAITFVGGPFIDQNTTKTSTITPSATTGNITLSSTASDTWDANHVGALWEISYLLDANSVGGSFCMNWAPASNPPSDSVAIQKNRYYDFTTGGSWGGTMRLQRSYDDGVTWEDVFAHSSVNSAPITYAGQEFYDDALYRVDIDEDYTRADRSYAIYNLVARPFELNGVVQITDVNDANDAVATVTKTLGGITATHRWAEGAWSDYRGWPRTISHHEQRAVYGGSGSWPQTLWGSIIASQDDDYDDFTVGEGNADDAWTYILPGMNPIQWVSSADYLMIGTTGNVGRMGLPEKGITPTESPVYKTQAKNGSAYIQPVDAIDALLFVERGGTKVRELTYTYSSDRFIAPDMTILSEHITGNGIVEIDFQNRPDPILWAIREDGQMLSFTYERKQEVLAWARHVTGQDPNDWTSWDKFESVAVIPGAGTTPAGDDWIEDAVYVVVLRDVNGTDHRFVEMLTPLDWGDDPNYCWFVDCGGEGLTYTGTDEVTGTQDVAATYKFTYLGDNGDVWGIPLGDTDYYTAMSSDANNIGGGVVGIPYENNPFEEGWRVVVNGTTNYDGMYTLPTQGLNELRLTASYVAESFDGTEFAGRYLYNGIASYGRIAIDNDGYIWVGHSWGFVPGTSVSRIDPSDETISRSELTWDTLPAVPGVWGTTGLCAQGGDSLFVAYGGYIYRFAMPGGTETWAVAGGGDMDIDDSNNVYALVAYNATRYAAADGATTTYTDCGGQRPGVWFGGGFSLHYAEELDLICVGSSSQIMPDSGDWQNLFANFSVRTPDDSAGDTLVLGTTWTEQVGQYFLRMTPQVPTGHITSDSDYIYVLVFENDTTSTIFKLSWDGSSLTIEDSATATSVLSGGGIWFDLWGNLVVANLPGSAEDRLYYYDPNDLSELDGIDNIPTSAMDAWNGMGAYYMQGWGNEDGHLGITGEDAVVAVPGEWSIGDVNQLTDTWLCLYADAIPRGTFYASDDVVADWNDTYTTVIAGINYYSIYESMPIVTEQGQTQSKQTMLKDVTVDFYETMGAHIGTSYTYSADQKFSYDDWATTIDPFTGYKGPVGLMRGTGRDPTVYIWEWDPLPMCIRSIHTTQEVTVE